MVIRIREWLSHDVGGLQHFTESDRAKAAPSGFGDYFRQCVEHGLRRTFGASTVMQEDDCSTFE
jgi:hypothetical protein